jgi:lipopolysaccharide export system protein LptC
MMKQRLSGLMLAVAATALLAGCKTGSTVRIENQAPQPATQARSEPIFYNGKTYQLDFRPNGAGAYDMAVSGMGPKQRKDAVAVATSSLGYYACPEGQKGRLQNEPAYANAKWRMQAKCG